MEVDEGFQEQPAEVDVVGELVVEAGTAFHMGSMMTELEDPKMETLNMSGLSYTNTNNPCIPIIIVGKPATQAGGVPAKGRWSNSGEGKTGEVTDRCMRGRRCRSRTCGCNCKGVRGPWWIRLKAQRAQCLT